MVPTVIHIRIGTFFFLRFFFRIYENLWLIFESSLLIISKMFLKCYVDFVKLTVGSVFL